MKNIPEIKSRLIKFKDENDLVAYANLEARERGFSQELCKVVSTEANSFLTTLIRHMDSKKPSKSTIRGLFNKSYFRLQHLGLGEKEIEFSMLLYEKIMNSFADLMEKDKDPEPEEILNKLVGRMKSSMKAGGLNLDDYLPKT